MINDFIILGNKEGYQYRYAILWFKDSEWITLSDEDDDLYFWKEGKSKNIGTSEQGTEESVSAEPDRVQKIEGSFRKKPIDLGYSEKYKEKSLHINHLPDKESFRWRVVRSIRWKPITDAVEARYKIPEWLILAMMSQEGYWDPTLPNLGNDGWLGLIHIQAVNAYQFWLKTLPRFTKRMRDKRHAHLINWIKEKHSNNLRELIRYDDRFHPIMAVDVAARFLMEHYKRAKRRNPSIPEHSLWDMALKWYSWRPYSWRRGYWEKVRAYQAGITAKSYIASINAEFNTYGVSTEWKSMTFAEYREHFRKMCENYELDKYKLLWKYDKKNWR